MSSDNYYCGVCGEELTERDSNGMLYCGKCIPNNITQSTDTPSDTPRNPSPRCEHGTLLGYCEVCNYNEAGFARQRIPELEAELETAKADLAAANKRLEEARTVLDKSEKWLKRLRSCLPSHGSFGESGRDDHESVISSIEKAIAAIDGKEGES